MRLNDEPASEMVKMMSHQALDPAQLQSWRDLLSGDEQTTILRDLIDSFLSESTTQLAALHAALQAGNPVACRSHAHSLVNGCVVIGAQHIAKLCSEMERLAIAERPSLSV